MATQRFIQPDEELSRLIPAWPSIRGEPPVEVRPERHPGLPSPECPRDLAPFPSLRLSQRVLEPWGPEEGGYVVEQKPLSLPLEYHRALVLSPWRVKKGCEGGRSVEHHDDPLVTAPRTERGAPSQAPAEEGAGAQPEGPKRKWKNHGDELFPGSQKEW